MTVNPRVPGSGDPRVPPAYIAPPSRPAGKGNEVGGKKNTTESKGKKPTKRRTVNGAIQYKPLTDKRKCLNPPNRPPRVNKKGTEPQETKAESQNAKWKPARPKGQPKPPAKAGIQPISMGLKQRHQAQAQRWQAAVPKSEYEAAHPDDKGTRDHKKPDKSGFLSSFRKQKALNEEGFWNALNNLDDKEVARLIDKGLSPSLSKDGKSALMIAIEQGSKELVEVLAKNNPDINRPEGTDGKTPLIKVLEKQSDQRPPISGDLQKLSILLANGADVNQTDKSGRSPLMLIIQKLDTGPAMQLRFIDSYLAKKKNLTTAQYDLIKQSYEEQMQPFYDILKRTDEKTLNLQNPEGQSALMMAVELGNADAVRALFKKGAKRSIQNKEGQTALDIAKALKEKDPSPNNADIIKALTQKRGTHNRSKHRVKKYLKNQKFER